MISVYYKTKKPVNIIIHGLFIDLLVSVRLFSFKIRIRIDA